MMNFRLKRITCVFCKCVIVYKEGHLKRFIRHVKFDHGIIFNVKYFMASCYLDVEELNAVTGVVFEKNKLEVSDEAVASVMLHNDKVTNKVAVINYNTGIVKYQCLNIEEHKSNFLSDSEKEQEKKRCSIYKALDDDEDTNSSVKEVSFSVKRKADVIYSVVKSNDLTSVPQDVYQNSPKIRKVEEYHSKINTQDIERRQSPINMMKFTCDLCDNQYYRKGDLTRHKKHKHENSVKIKEKENSVEKISQIADVKSIDLAHENNLLDDHDIDTTDTLNVSSEKLITTSSLQVANSPESKQKVFKCGDCDIEYSRKGDLSKHKKSKHDQDRIALHVDPIKSMAEDISFKMDQYIASPSFDDNSVASDKLSPNEFRENTNIISRTENDTLSNVTDACELNSPKDASPTEMERIVNVTASPVKNNDAHPVDQNTQVFQKANITCDTSVQQEISCESCEKICKKYSSQNLKIEKVHAVHMNFKQKMEEEKSTSSIFIGLDETVSLSKEEHVNAMQDPFLFDMREKLLSEPEDDQENIQPLPYMSDETDGIVASETVEKERTASIAIMMDTTEATTSLSMEGEPNSLIMDVDEALDNDFILM